MKKEEKKPMQNKHDYFQQIAGKRLDRILDALDALGNCSTPATYDYNLQDLPPIFAAIMEKIEDIRQRLITRSSHSGVPFRLQPPESFELDGCSIRITELATESEASELLSEGAPCFTSLEPIRERYEAKFGKDLCWTCPVFHDGYTGCVLLLIQEGVLYLPYKDVDNETYEQFDLQGIALMKDAQIQSLRRGLRDTYTQLSLVLSGIQAFGLVRSSQIGEDDSE
ncbi:hypothetical protein D7V91_11545 [bacterium 1xD42-67]|nr:hypothetical protein D7V91_11545 [bacterium 1xD42-67]